MRVREDSVPLLGPQDSNNSCSLTWHLPPGLPLSPAPTVTPTATSLSQALSLCHQTSWPSDLAPHTQPAGTEAAPVFACVTRGNLCVTPP